MLVVLLAACAASVNAHMSMQFPLARNRDSGGNNYAVWKLNEPMIPARPHVCHGLPAESSVRPENVFKAGEVITLEIEGTASHYGGHCSFWYSTDDVTFTKIVDVRDCTLAPDTTQVQLPQTMPAACGTRCTFAWTWVPRVSGTCEVYSNCADIRVTGLSGDSLVDPNRKDFVDLVARQDELCQRVNEDTHWSGLFMPLILHDGTYPPTAPTAPTTPAPLMTPAPTITPSPIDGTGIKVASEGSISMWWYAAKLLDIAPGHGDDVEMAVGSAGSWYWCEIDTSSMSKVYKCAPPSEGFVLPLSVRLWEDFAGGEELEVADVVTNWDMNAVFDMGVNFGGDGPGPSPVTPPTTPAPNTPAPIEPSESITATNVQSCGQWWYSAEIERVRSPIFIDMFEIRSANGPYNFCHGVSLSKCTVFECQPPGNAPYEYPLSVRMLGSNGQIIEAIDAIQTPEEGKTWNLGINFDVKGFTPAPTPPPVTPAPNMPPSTPAPNAPPSTPSPITPAPNAAPSTPRPSTPSPTRPDNPAVHDKEIIGYYPAWQWYDRSKTAAPANLDFSKYTIINFAFFQPDDEGNLFGTDNWADFNVLWGPEISWPVDEQAENYKCHLGLESGKQVKMCRNSEVEQGLIHLVHAAGGKIFPSLGGWTLSDKFPAIAADPAKRARLAEQCVELIKMYGFDGIDVDWEYPGYADHSGTPADTVNYNLLLQDIRDALDAYSHEDADSDKYYQLTAALPCGVNHINNIDGPTVTHLLDQFNLMTYDLFGTFSERTGANAPLYYQGWPADLPDNSVDGCVKNWRAQGVPDNKINIGLPFYGRSYAQATGMNQPHPGKADLTHWGVDEGVPQFFNIELEINSGALNVDRHEQSMTETGYFDGGGFVSFDDQQAICDKVEYCLDEGLNGFIVWEITGDVRSNLETPLIDEVHMKLEYPDTLDCESRKVRAMPKSGNGGKDSQKTRQRDMRY